MFELLVRYYKNMKVYLIHAWGESPQSCWYPWLKQQLEAKGYEVITPAMPDTDEPQIEPWVSTLSQLEPNPKQDTIFIGHSIGCQTILRYLEKLPAATKVGGVFFVTPWTGLENLEEESKSVAKPWLETPIDWEVAKSHSPSFIAFFSNNDPWVPLSEEEVFQNKLNAGTRVFEGAGHFDEQTQFPELLDKVLQA